MAIGSNSLALLFKIGVDASDAEKQLAGLGKVASDIGTAFKQGLGEGAVKGAKDFEQATTGALQRVGNSLQQTRSGLENLFRGDVLEGTTQLVRQFGVLAVGLGAIAAAGLAAKKSIEGILDVAEKVGTDSKEDFEEFQASIARVGGQVTLLDHALGQELVKSAGDVKSAFDKMFVKMLEIEGPALILLFKDIVKFINGPLTTASDNWAKRQVEGIIQFIALGRALDAYFNLPSNLRTFGMFQKITPAYIEQVRRELEGLTASFQGATGSFDTDDKATKTIKATKDLTQAQLEANEAARDFALLREKAASEQAEINRQLKAGAIDPDEALARRLAIQQTLFNFERDFLDAEKARIEAEVQGENRRTDALEDNANKRKILEDKDAAAQKALSDQATEDWNKYTQARLKQLDTILKRGQEVGDAVVKAQARAAQDIPGGGTGIPGLPDPGAVDDQLKAIHDSFNTFFQQLEDGFNKSGTVFSSFTELAIGALEGVAKAAEETFAAFILTGQLGAAAFKRFVAQIIATVAVESAVKAVFEFAEAAASMAVGDISGFIKHTAAANMYLDVAVVAAAAGAIIGATGGLGGGATAGAAAAGGGFGGAGSEPPGTVTINQGGPGTLGVQLLSSIDQHLSNITTAPAGDVLQRGAEQNPMVVGQANNEAARRDGTVSREFLQISGLRTA
jgi:hypothetical protein